MARDCSTAARRLTAERAFEKGPACLASLHPLRQRRGQNRGPGDSSLERLVNVDVIDFERGADRLIKSDAGVGVIGQSFHFGGLRRSEGLFILDHLKNHGGAESIALLVRSRV